jgi:hypothetical protein
LPHPREPRLANRADCTNRASGQTARPGTNRAGGTSRGDEATARVGTNRAC